MNTRTQVIKYLVFDVFSAILTWSCFFIFRKIYIEPQAFGQEVALEFDTKYFLGLGIIPILWLLLYYAAGHYKDIYKKSRLNEFGQTFLISLIGAIIIFFLVILDDTILTYKNYYTSFLVLFSLHFIFTYLPRLSITSVTIRQLKKGKLGFNTIIIGGNENAIELYKELEIKQFSNGNKITGFVSVKNGISTKLKNAIPYLGELKNLHNIIEEHHIQEIILAIETNEHDMISDIMEKTEYLNITIKAIPDMYDILTGHAKITTIFGTPLIQVSDEPLSPWQMSIKQFLDIIISLIAILILLPVFIVVAIAIKFNSKGSIIYKHERIGKYGKPFMIYKFRSMYVDAEKSGPQLSKKNDARITKIGRFLRKTRLDEIPNFFNVLKGDMSLVGPRPERKYFIEKIVEKAPHYYQLHKIKPGITSLGQVKFGYAENVNQMLMRLRYDIIYLKNMSLFIDFQIMLYTVVTIFKGKGL